MARKKNTTTLAEKEYTKELKRIQQFLRRASKRGFIWDDNVIPKRPKKITEKSVAKLKRLTPDVLYKKGEYLNTSTGELLSGAKGRELERKKAAEKALETRKAKKEKKHNKHKDKNKPKNKAPEQPTQDEYLPSFSTIVLENVRYMLSSFAPPDYWSITFKEKKWHDKSVAEYILNRAIQNEGEDAVALRLNYIGSEQMNELVIAILYDSEAESVSYNLMRFSEILNGGPLNALEAQEIAEMSEGMENWELPK